MEKDSPFLGGKLMLINGTKFKSTAELICYSGIRPGIQITCREDGTWSRLEATCLYQNNGIEFVFKIKLNLISIEILIFYLSKLSLWKRRVQRFEHQYCGNDFGFYGYRCVHCNYRFDMLFI